MIPPQKKGDQPESILFHPYLLNILDDVAERLNLSNAGPSVM